jgi:protein-cysteine N-palmitoyltransferase HHAT
MTLLLIFHPLLRRLYKALCPTCTTDTKENTKTNGCAQLHVSASEVQARVNQRVSFDFGFALAFLCALHGFSALKILTILYINFCIATRLPRPYVPAATWVFNIGTLFANELSSGYKFENMVGYFSHDSAPEKIELHNWGTWLDGYGGILPRWEVLFNITVLRLISFNLDYYWSQDRGVGSPLEVSAMKF